MKDIDIKREIYDENGFVNRKKAMDFFMKLGLSSEDAKKLIDRIESGYEFYINPEYVVVESGSQIFGSGGYSASWKTWLGSVEIIGKKDISSNFISAYEAKVVPSKRPCVVSCYSYDDIGGGRYFKRFVAVWI